MTSTTIENAMLGYIQYLEARQAPALDRWCPLEQFLLDSGISARELVELAGFDEDHADHCAMIAVVVGMARGDEPVSGELASGFWSGLERRGLRDLRLRQAAWFCKRRGQQ